ncbi:unnamed protein product [Chrysoparadoxa australica]
MYWLLSLLAVISHSMAMTDPAQALYIKTPLVHSLTLSRLAEVPVYLKLEALQPSGSFKDRGMGKLCSELKSQGVQQLISSSGGNAGHSVAHAGRILNIPVTVIVPETTKAIMLDKIKAQGAKVIVHGVNWNAADELAREMVQEDDLARYVSPYDDPLLWEGHSSMVDEIAEAGIKPGAIIASVGGGGLLCGILDGCKRHGWEDVVIVPAETDGAASFAAAHKAGKVVRLASIDTVATSLGALEVTPEALKRSEAFTTRPEVVSDAQAVAACMSFASDHRLLVEPACGAALAVLYSKEHRETLAGIGSIVVVVCGGSGVNLEILDNWCKSFGVAAAP